MNKDLIYIAKILSSHGVKGNVKLKSFTSNPLDIFTLKNVQDENGKIYNLSRYGKTNGDSLIATIEGISVKEDADLLKNTKLYVERKDLPKLSENEIYINDLIGFTAIAKGKTLGEVIGIQNFGAGDILEINVNEQKKLISFNPDAVLNIDEGKKEIVINEEHLL